MARPVPRDRVKFRYKPQFGVIVVCDDEAAQRALYDRLVALGLACRVVTT